MLDPTTVLGLPTTHALTPIVPWRSVPGSGFWYKTKKTQGSENSRGCAAVWRGALSPQARLLHPALLRLSKGCGQPRRVRAFPPARARRARLTTALGEAQEGQVQQAYLRGGAPLHTAAQPLLFSEP